MRKAIIMLANQIGLLARTMRTYIKVHADDLALLDAKIQHLAQIQQSHMDLVEARREAELKKGK